MYIQPNLSFSLHAHPNCEAIYVLKGAIYEYRYADGDDYDDYDDVMLNRNLRSTLTWQGGSPEIADSSTNFNFNFEEKSKANNSVSTIPSSCALLPN